MSSSFNWLTTSFSWIRRGRKAHFQPKAPLFRPVIENLEGRLNPAPVASLPQLLDMPHSLVVLSPDIASQVPVAEYAGARVVTLDPTRDAISQISDSLAGQSSVTSLRVIGHGQPGSLSLAGQTINLATLQARSVEVAAWARHLTPDADILLYGCSVASTVGGRAFVNTLATLTGADVAASTDATGTGGNLTLEYTTGGVADHLQASPQAWTKSGLQLPSEGEYNYNTNPDGTSVTITGYTGPGGAVTIPGTLGGLPVTAIGNDAFYNESSLTSVTIPSSVTSIGDLVFNNCSSLTAIEVAVTSNDFSSVDGVLFNKAQTTLIQCPGGKAGTYTIPESVTFIRNRALSACFSLTSIEVAVNSNDFSSIDGVLFNKTQTTLIQCPGGKSGSYTIPKSVTVIGDDSFGLCDRLTSVTIPNSVISIGSSAFALCTSLTSMTIPESVTSIGDGAFLLCVSLTSVTILPGVTTIGDSAFGYCGGLTSMTIPEGVTSIGNYAFGSCVSLTRVTIFPGVTTIGDSAFGYCWGLTRINTLGNAPALVGSEAFYQVPATLYYTSGTLGWTNPWEGLPTVEMTGGDYKFSINTDGTSVTITGYTGPGGVVTIPGTLADLPVTRIGGSAFQENSSLTSVTIPEGVTLIGEWAFAGCRSLTSVTIPGSVTLIGEGAFASCQSLTSVTIPKGVTAIGGSAFADCSSLTSLTLPESLTSIGIAAFNSCSSLTSLTIPEGVTSIGTYAFGSCNSLTAIEVDTANNDFSSVDGILFNKAQTTLIQCPEGKAGSVIIPSSVTSIGTYAFGSCKSLTSVTIPSSVTSIGNSAFDSCKSLTSLTIPASVTSIGEWAFASCSSLTAIEVDVANNDFSSVDGVLFNTAQTTLIQCPAGKAGTYTIPGSVTSIGTSAFASCQSLTSVTIPSSVTSIGDAAFYFCTGMTSLTILPGVTTIGDYAFYLCGSLTSMTIPASVTSIGIWVFVDCSSLTAIEVDGANKDFISVDGVLFNKAQTNLIQFPAGKAGTCTIPGSVTSIGYGAFASCISLNSVTMSSSVTSIGDGAFAGCTGLTRINTLGNAPALGNDVFANVPATLYYTSGTTGWTNPWGGLPTVEMTGGDYQFSINLDGTSVTITGYTGPGGAISIPATLVGLPVTAIGEAAFNQNSSLTSVAIPKSVSSIGKSAFDNCVFLTTVTIPESVTSIGESAFAVCVSLTSVTIPESVTSIGVSIFTSCSSLISVTIPESVTSIGEWAFAGCSSLTSLTIPYSVTSIGEWAFSSCRSLTAIEVDGTNNDFSSRNGILFNKAQTILIQYPAGIAGTYTIPSSVISIGGGAFYSCGGLTSVTISEGVNSIGESAFSSCSSLTRINTLGNAPALVGSDVFNQVPATLYYTSGTTGWTNPWGGLPTVASSPVAAPFSLAAGSLVASLGDGKIGILSATGNYQEIYPFPGYEGPLNVNTVNSAAGQNADTIVVAVAGRSLPHVLTIDSSTGFVTSSFYAFDPGFLGGVTVAGGVTRIGGEITVSPEGVVTRIGGVITSVILCGAGSGSSPSVSVFNAASSQPMGAFYAYSNQYLGGVRVALSEADADGVSFAIIGSTINSHVVAFDLNDYYNPILSFNAFPDNLTPQGVYVASGDLDGDNLNEIVVGAGQGNASPQVAVFDMAGKLKKSFNAFDMSFLGGVQVGVADFNRDGKLDILAASGVGVPGDLNIFNYDNLALIDTLFISDSTLGFDVASNFSRG